METIEAPMLDPLVELEAAARAQLTAWLAERRRPVAIDNLTATDRGGRILFRGNERAWVVSGSCVAEVADDPDLIETALGWVR